MDFIIRCCERRWAELRNIADNMSVRNKKFLLIAITYWLCFELAHADFVVKDVQANLVRQELLVSTKIDLNLSDQAELAVENGVPLVVLTEFALVRNGLLWNDTLFRHRNGQRLRYHSLSDRYVVENLEMDKIDTYGSVTEALQSMGVFRSLVFTVPEEIKADSPDYALVVRSRIDINRLPAALRPLAFFSPSWQLSSDWTSWQITNP